MARRLSPLDIAFLKMETPEAPSHVAGLQIFEIPKGYKGSFVADLKSKLSATTVGQPFNLRLGSRGLPFAMPAWVPDKNFDIDFHLRHSALPRPGRIEELMKLVSRLHGRLLDRSRPLWEMYLIEGLEGNRFALYTKIHHALVDGVGGMKMVEQSFSRSADDPDPKAPWMLEPPTKAAKPKLSRAESSKKLAQSLIKPIGTLPQAVKALAMPGKTEAAIAFKTSKTVFNGHITASRRFAIHSLPLTETKELGKVLGHTVNDMFLAICAGALKRYLDEKGMTPDLPLTATVPVSIQVKGEEKRGNQITYVAVNLCTNVGDPIARLKAIGRSAAAAKHDMGQLPRDAIKTLAVVAQSMAAMINQFRLSEYMPPPANLVLSNVPGPRDDLYFMGAKLIGYYPMSILMDGQALNITLCSHGDKLDFGILGCRSALPDLDRLGDLIGEAYQELQAAAGIKPKKSKPKTTSAAKAKASSPTKVAVQAETPAVPTSTPGQAPTA
jgi:diacylglycerol O-acyltransferase